MKKHILAAALGLLAPAAHAQQPPTAIHQKYDVARNRAEQGGKLLIVDFYTTWCAPCKVLDKTIFGNDSLAGLIGKDFIVLKYDAEQDSIYNLSLKHHIASYPTTVVLTPDGQTLRKMYGTGGGGSLAATYTELLRESRDLARQRTYLTGYAPVITPAQYPDFYKKYVRRIADLKPGDLAKYWEGKEAVRGEVDFAILAYFGRAPQRVTDHFVQHRSDYEKLYGTADVRFVVGGILGDNFRAAVAEKSLSQYENAIRFARLHATAAEADRYIAAYELELYAATGAWEQALRRVEERLQAGTLDDHGINSFCWTVYEHGNDPKIMDRAAQLMKAVTDREASFATLDTYARLLAKTGNTKDATAAMKRAIELGKADGQDTTDSEDALRQF